MRCSLHSVAVALVSLAAVAVIFAGLAAARERKYSTIAPHMLEQIMRTKYQLPASLAHVRDEIAQRVEKSHRFRSGEPFEELFAEFAEKTQETRNALPAPQWTAICTVAAQQFEEKGNVDRAIEFYRRATETDETFLYPRNRLALLYLREGQAAQAADILEVTVRRANNEQYEDASDAYVALSVLSMLADEKEEAREMLQRALQYDYENVPAWMRLGHLHLKSGEANAAIAAFENAIRMNSSHALGYHSLAQALLVRAKNPEKAGPLPDAATHEGQSSIGSEPGSSDAITGEESPPRDAEPASAATRLPDPDEDTNQAEDLLRTAIKLDPDFHIASIQLARLLARDRSRREEAVAVLKRAIATSSPIPRLHIVLAEILIEMGRSLEGIHHLEAVLALDPRFIEAHLLMTTTYANIAQYDKAIESLDKSLEYVEFVQPKHKEKFKENAAKMRAEYIEKRNAEINRLVD